MLHYIVSTSTESQMVNGNNATLTYNLTANDTTCSIVAVNNKNYTSKEVRFVPIIEISAVPGSSKGKFNICITASKNVGS